MNKVSAKIFGAFQNFIQAEQSSGIILILATVVSLSIANSPLGEGWEHFWEHTYIGFANIGLSKSIVHWVNDGLMTIFFLLVGLEIKKEIIEGELSSIKKSFLPIIAAVGGMVVPAIIYATINLGKESFSGWGIPMATDIAFALGILAMIGKRVPFSLKVMLAALAIVDDLGAIIVIAIFYSQQMDLYYLLYAIGTFAFLLLINKSGVKLTGLYLIIGVFLWYFTLKSGIHATISGVLLAIALPLGKGELNSSAEKLKHFLEKPVAFLIMPVFALANTGFMLNSNFSDVITSTASIGIILGLLIGKPLGIFLFSWVSIKLKLSNMPSEANWNQLLGIGFLGGIGFTMSIFIALLAYNNETLVVYAKVSILIGSVLSGVIGFILLKSSTKPVAKIS
jgi:NhaA family Na+:H+ antiporter